MKEKAPTSDTLNEVDLYLLVCIGMVFFALLEYSLVLLKERLGVTNISCFKKHHKGEIQIKVSSTNSNDKPKTERTEIRRGKWIYESTRWNIIVDFLAGTIGD